MGIKGNPQVKINCAYELSICNTVRELCQLRDNLYSCDICIDMTDITAMLNDVCTE